MIGVDTNILVRYLTHPTNCFDLPISVIFSQVINIRNIFMLGLDRITFDPNIMGGQACIRGMRIPVSLVVNLVANSKPVEEILEEYPDLEPEDIRQSLLYAAWLTQERVYPFKTA